MNVSAWCWYALTGSPQDDLLQKGNLFMESFRRAFDGGIGIWPILADKVASRVLWLPSKSYSRRSARLMSRTSSPFIALGQH